MDSQTTDLKGSQRFSSTTVSFHRGANWSLKRLSDFPKVTFSQCESQAKNLHILIPCPVFFLLHSFINKHVLSIYFVSGAGDMKMNKTQCLLSRVYTQKAEWYVQINNNNYKKKKQKTLHHRVIKAEKRDLRAGRTVRREGVVLHQGCRRRERHPLPTLSIFLHPICFLP